VLLNRYCSFAQRKPRSLRKVVFLKYPYSAIMKNALVALFLSFFCISNLNAQTYVAGQACRYQCFGTCDNVYQTYVTGSSPRIYLFDGSQGTFASLQCSNYTVSTTSGSCKVRQTLAGVTTDYNGFSITITKVIRCPLDGNVLIFGFFLAGVGYFHLMGKKKRMV
jgi:hypothetical protein